MERYPLSRTEYGIYIEQTNMQNTAYNVPLTVPLSPNTDMERLKDAIRVVVERHPCLKTGFGIDEKGEVYKYIRDCEVEVKTFRTSHFELADLVKPFDLHTDILYRFYLVEESKRKLLFFDIHHIIYDGSSNAVFLSQINDAYNGVIPEPETFSAVDYAMEEATLIASESYQKARENYKREFEGVDTDSSLFSDNNGRDHRAAALSYELRYVDSDALKAFAAAFGVKLSTVFNAAFAFLLSRHTNSCQVLYATVFHGRDRRLAESIGMFVKTIPVYADLSSVSTVGEFLIRLDRHIEDNRRHSLYSFADFCADTGLQPGFLFAYQGDMLREIPFCGGESLPVLNPLTDAKDIFELTVWRREGRFVAHAEYPMDQYDDAVIRDLCESLDKILCDMLHTHRLSDIDMLTPEQLFRLEKQNHHEQACDSRSIVTLFRQQVEETPDNTAIVYQEKRFSYLMLDRLSENVSAFLKSKGIGKEDVVSVLMPRCEWFPVASLGILKAGAAYQPLDPTYPSERLGFMIRDADAKLLIADRNLLNLLPDYTGVCLCMDEIAALPEADRGSEYPDPEDLFVLLYTSGSTGVPKGVMLEHRNISAFCSWYIRNYNLDDSCRVAAYASFGFDAHLMDFYPALISGAEVHVIGEDIRLNLLGVKEYFQTHRITHSFMTTQVGRQYAELFPDAPYPHYLSVGGERLVPLEPPVSYTLTNGYGPTECTVFANTFRVDALYDRVPVGWAVDNSKQYVVDGQGRRVPIGVPGELLIAGYQVGRGYLGRPEQTGRSFIRNPFCSDAGYERAYRTGDIVRLRSDGTIDFIGRNDGQVKIRGFRIELSEVEGVIRRFQGIRDATVQAFDEQGGGKYIAAYVVSDSPVDIDALNSFILQEKPPYMVPSVIMQIERIPLNQNQKVNVRALPAPTKKAQNLQPPQNDTQRRIHECIAKCAGSADFGIHTDIFDAGLTSIGAIRLIVLLSGEFDAPVTVRDLRAHPTVAALETFLTGLGSAAAHEVQTDYPLTQTQNGILVECLSRPDSTIYNIPYLFRLSGSIDLEKLRKAAEAAVNAHPCLKGVLFADEEGNIRIRRNDDAEAIIEFSETEETPEFHATPFELLGGRLYRIRIFKTPESAFLFLEIHHIICDGTSEAILLEDIDSSYSGNSLEKERYTGFEAALDEQEARKSEKYWKAKEYYERLLTGAEHNILPACGKQKGDPSSDQITVLSTLDMEKVGKYCAENNVTENAFFNAVFAFTLGKFSNRDEALYSTIYNGRSDSRMNRSVTMLVKTLPVYCSLNGETKIRDFVTAMGEQMMNSMANDIYSFAEISHAFDLPTDILFAFQGSSFLFNSIGGEAAEMIPLPLSEAKAPITLNLFVRDGKAEMLCEYRSDLYSESFMCTFIVCMEKAAEEFTIREKIKEVRILSEAAEKQIECFNATETDLPRTTCNRLLEHQAEHFPDRIAVIAGGAHMTYRELNKSANRIAHSLLADGIQPDGLVAVMMPRTVEAYAVREGVLKAGGAFLPLAPDYPDGRVEYILENSGADFAVTTAGIAAEKAHLFDQAGVKVRTVETLLQCPDSSNPDPEITPENLCYCLYTSGSTGKPKGAMIEHHSLVNLVQKNRFNVIAGEYGENIRTALAFTALTFDASVFEEAHGLYSGDTVVMATDEEINNPVLLARLIRENNVEEMLCTPSYISNLLDFPDAVDALLRLKVIIVAAEAFPAPLYEKMRSLGIRARIYNGYGPTEATIAATFELLTDERITIGKPLANIKVLIRDAYGNALPPFVPGELTILGEGVGRGYIANKSLTEEKFLTIGGLPAYRTGDLAYWRDDGKLAFLGRMDNQVKLRGLRVELDEVENSINTFPGILRTVVTVKENEKTGQFLCAYYTAVGPIDQDLLRRHIGETLASYMIPSVFVPMDAFPLTANGKVNKKALPEPADTKAVKEFHPPRTVLEEKLCSIFANTLGIDRIGIDENFFELGGTSLTASRIAIKGDAEGLPIAFKDVFEYPTVESMACYVLRQLSSAEPEIDVPSASNESRQEEDALAFNRPEYLKNITAEKLGTVLLTGATGFLGIHVLKHLLDTTDGKIFCLIRSGRLSSERRLMNMLMYYFSSTYEEYFGGRIEIIDGDITDRAGALSLGKYDFDTVINCAACVKHFSRDDTLERINFHGVENLVELCLETGRKLVQASTVSVAGSSVNNQFSPDRKIREFELYFGQNLGNKYVNTKFRAEEAIIKAIRENGLNGKIIRLGNLMSRYSDGEFQINALTSGFMRSLRAYASLGMISVSALDAPVEFSPIDCTASALVSLAGTGKDFTVFHATNAHAVQMGDVVEAMNRAGIPIAVVEEEEFAEAFRDALSDDQRSSVVSPLISYQASDKNSVEFFLGYDNTFTTKALYRLGCKWPIISEQYLDRAFRSLSTLGYFDFSLE